MSAFIETHNLSKSYGRSRGIRDISLEVSGGEVFGFLGPNGAGKTTMIRTLLGFLRPSGGWARLFGLDSVRNSVAIRQRLGNLPGEFSLEEHTGRELLDFYARLRGVRDLTYGLELAERLGAQLETPMRRLSRGNKQKIGLLQALFHRPPLLILDEPTGGLDPLVQEEFLKIIAERKLEGCTIFFSSHVLSEVERVCDRVGIIRQGELVEVEPTHALLDKHFRHVQLTFDNDEKEAPPGELFASLPGVRKLRTEGPEVSFTFEGRLDALVKLIARYPLRDMRLEQPSLEEVFLTYYEKMP